MADQPRDRQLLVMRSTVDEPQVFMPGNIDDSFCYLLRVCPSFAL